MNYVEEFTIPAKQPEYNPSILVITPIVGFFVGGQVTFAAGALNVVRFRIMDENRQLYPYPHGWKAGNNATIAFEIKKRLQGPPYRIVIQGYSDAIDWPHKLIIDLEVIR